MDLPTPSAPEKAPRKVVKVVKARAAATTASAPLAADVVPEAPAAPAPVASTTPAAALLVKAPAAPAPVASTTPAAPTAGLSAGIEALTVDLGAIVARIAKELGVRSGQVDAVIKLTAEGSTVPFISRYRKEATGNLDEVQVRDSVHSFESYKNLEERRIEVIKGIAALGKLDETLYANIKKAATLAEIEDLWAPYKKKKKTRGMLAQEKGLSPLAEIMLAQAKDEVDAAAPGFVRADVEHPELSVASASEAIEGAKDIVAERLSQNAEMRALVKDFYHKTGRLSTKGVGGDEKRETSTYQMYWEYSEPLSTLKSHRVLAVNRGEREGELEVKIEVDEDGALERIAEKAWIHNDYHKEALAEGLSRLLSPAVLREIRTDATEYSETHAIDVFSENLKNLLLQPPLRGSRVLGMDPGIRTGTKCAALDETGKFLDYFVINQETKPEEAKKAVAKSVKAHRIQLIAVGNGTASHEVQVIVAAAIEENALDCKFTIVDEDGASVYSAGDIAREEFPDLDLTIRGAISIGRRLQDPLAELVKIDPKSIGVGLYQHDVNQKKLSTCLDEVVGSVVNRVGVNLNTASHALLRYVSGINTGLARKIVKFRDEKGAITGRDSLRDIPGMGDKTFEQCAGFLKIPESANELDNTWVHPENYPLASEILPMIKAGADPDHEQRAALKAKYGVGETTLDDILAELKKPNRDPRENLPAPILQKGVLKFEDLAEGMKVTGKIKNVVDFGAFVDIGIKESALIHVSELSDRFVKDPMEVVKVGDVREFRILSLDMARRRIGLSLKAEQGAANMAGAHGMHNQSAAVAAKGRQPTPGAAPVRDAQASHGDARPAPGVTKTAPYPAPGAAPGRVAGPSYGPGQGGRPERPGERPVRPERPGERSYQGSGSAPRTPHPAQGPGRPEKSWDRPAPRPEKEDDGMTYNPFVELLKNRKR
ncbi:MAG: Tex-like N-terminal domain-containing protein [Rectinemataceae bacterium]